MMDDAESVLQWLDEMSAISRARVRRVIADAGRTDILVEYDRNIRNLDLGLTSARSCWHSISPAQANALAVVGVGGSLRRHPGQKSFYDYYGEPHALSKVCGIKTARALCAHELLAPDGGAFDPEAKFVITERGSFVLRFGYTIGTWWSGDPLTTAESK